MDPELRSGILRTPNQFSEVLWPALWGEHIFEKTHPKRTPDQKSGFSMPKTCYCVETFVKYQNTKVLLN